MKKLGIKERPKKKSFVNRICTRKVHTSRVFEIQIFGITGDS